jgi:ATP adenylyltransferase
VDRLWAPWRMAYIREEQPAGCVFCAAPAAGRDSENLILHRGGLCFAMLNAFPYNNGHLLIAPYEHIGELEDVPADTLAEMTQVTQLCVRALKVSHVPDGFNIGLNVGRLAGAGIDEHLHLHVVPRWGGDTNFMPVLADTKVIPQSLEACCDILRGTLERLLSE